MKIYDTRKYDRTPVYFNIYEKNVWHRDKSLSDALRDIDEGYETIEVDGYNQFQAYGDITSIRINAEDKYIYKKYDERDKYYAKNTIVTHKGMRYMATDKTHASLAPHISSNHFFKLDRGNEPICILRDDGTNTTSEYGYTYPDIFDNLRRGNIHKYFRDNDYIELIIGGYLYTMRFNIDVYHDYSYGSPYSENRNSPSTNIPHHIDLISDEIVPVSDTQYLNTGRPELFGGGLTSIADSREGVTNLFMYTSNSMIPKYHNKLNPILYRNIINKYAKSYDRPLKSADLVQNTNNINYGTFWQLREGEIFGHPVLSGRGPDMDTTTQYPSCRYIGPRRKIARLVGSTTSQKPGTYTTWSLVEGAMDCIYINEYGEATSNFAKQSDASNLLCFRIV